ncbi:MAG: cell division ATPase MinD [Nanoarchaeota archaeon]|nr:cell division ATPase MinD [Nanoarchaeota archaeon]
MKKIIVVASGKGGVGKTTTTINLAAALNHFGKNVLIIDANLTTPNVGIHLNAPEVPVNLNHVLNNEAEVSEAVYKHDSGIKVILSSLSIRELKKLKPEKLKNFRKDFLEMSDFVLVDCAAGLGHEATSIMEAADEIILVTNPEMPSLTDALKTIKVSEGLKKNVKGVIVNRVKKNKMELEPATVKDMLEVPVLGMVPEDIVMQHSLRLKNAVVHTHPKSKPSRAYKEIAAKLVDVYYDSDKDKENLFQRIFKRNL